jgi:hypothetical protein
LRISRGRDPVGHSQRQFLKLFRGKTFKAIFINNIEVLRPVPKAIL